MRPYDRGDPNYTRRQYLGYMQRFFNRRVKAGDLCPAWQTRDAMRDGLEQNIGLPPTLRYVPVVLMIGATMEEQLELRPNNVAYMWRGGWWCGLVFEGGGRCSEEFLTRELLLEHREAVHRVR